LLELLRSYLKNVFWFKVKADARFNPEEYIGYFEDLNRAPNAEIGPKDFFEMAYKMNIKV
jgi:hypothetical protein